MKNTSQAKSSKARGPLKATNVDARISDLLTMGKDMDYYLAQVWEDLESNDDWNASDNTNTLSEDGIQALDKLQSVVDAFLRHVSMLDVSKRKIPT